MKKIAVAAMVAALPVSLFGQSAIDAYRLSQSDLQGTARFVSMGAAFTALGGDLSTLNQNPAGIGLYRSSEIGLTLDIDFQSSDVNGQSSSRTGFTCPNFGYVGATPLDSDLMPYFQWGASYSRTQSFDRQYKGGFGRLDTSMSNYIANFSNGIDPYKMGQTETFNPYSSTDINWLSLLAFNSYIINPVGNGSQLTDQYNGLFKNGTTGNSLFDVRQRGYVDEYSVDFGGNLMNTVYWGIGFGVTDLSFSEETYYDEELQNARIAAAEGMGAGTKDGDAYFSLGNYRHISGTGFNFKIGAILKPINELRIGFAFHTPTYYNMSDSYSSDNFYSYSSSIPDGTAYSNIARYDWKLRTPWKMMLGAAGVVGGRFIISADYEYSAFDKMKTSDNNGNEFKEYTEDINFYYKPVSTIRLGAECRVTPSFSVRAGFAYSSTGVKSGINDGQDYIFTSGTNPAYTFDTSTRYITLGAGYRYKGFYIDLAYINRLRESTYHAFSPFDPAGGTLSAAEAGNSWVYSPACDFNTTDNNIVLSLGYKF